MNEHVLVFFRKPVLGRVKTRLSATIGDEKALSVYQWLADLTMDVVDQVKAECHCYFDELDEDFLANRGQFRHEQKGHDLGEKMGHAFSESLSTECAKAVLIGSDCPEIKPEIIEEAYLALENVDVVVGPALDGGIYLLGLKKYSDELFRGIKWGSSGVCERLLSNMAKLDLTVTSLSPLRDIDEWSDFQFHESAYRAYELKRMANVP